MNLLPIDLSRLNSRQLEAYRFQKISAILADFGYQTIRLSDDWNGADFIAQHIDGSYLMVQLKGRLTVARKYEKKNLWIAFPEGATWYLYPHDEVLQRLRHAKKVSVATTYDATGGYSFPRLSKELTELLREFVVGAVRTS